MAMRSGYVLVAIQAFASAELGPLCLCQRSSEDGTGTALSAFQVLSLVIGKSYRLAPRARCFLIALMKPRAAGTPTSSAMPPITCTGVLGSPVFWRIVLMLEAV